MAPRRIKSYIEGDDADYDSSLEGNEFSGDKIVLVAKSQRIILIFAQAGIGKSTELKVMARKLKSKFPLNWTVFMNLKVIFKNEDKIVSDLSFEDTKDIAMFFCEKILKVDNFEAEVFKHLFHAGRVIFLMDGFDEIRASCMQFVKHLMKAIENKTRNQLWITARPLMMFELKEFLNSTIFELKPFNDTSRRDFLMRTFKIKNVEVNLLAQALRDAEDFLQILKPWICRADDISHPLFLTMITEVISDCPNMKLSEVGAFLVFEEFTDRRIRQHMSVRETGKVWGNSKMFLDFHQKRAFQTIFLSNDDDADEVFDDDEQVNKVIKLCFEDSLSPEDVIEIGFMYADCEVFYFSQRTFAAFFVAQFIYEKIFLQKFHTKKELSAIMQVFATVLVQDQFKAVGSFLESALSVSECNDDVKAIEVVQTVATRTFNMPCYQEFIHSLIRRGHLYTCKIVSQKLLGKSFQKFWRHKCQSNNILMTAVLSQGYDFLHTLWFLINQMFPIETTKEMLQEVNSDGENIFEMSARSPDARVRKMFINKAELRKDSMKHDDFAKHFRMIKAAKSKRRSGVLNCVRGLFRSKSV